MPKAHHRSYGEDSTARKLLRERNKARIEEKRIRAKLVISNELCT
jgi:hypothetical protein